MPTFRDYFLAFVPIFVAVDAFGILPGYLSLVSGMKPEARRQLVRHSTFTALVVALVFLWVGKYAFAWLGVQISDFLVAGGAILFILSIRDLLSFDKTSGLPPGSTGVVPLAVPLMVGPAVLTTSVILLSTFGILPTVFSLVSNILLCGVVLSFADFLSRVLGDTGSRTLSKVSSLLLGAIGVMLVRRGLFAILTGWIQSAR